MNDYTSARRKQASIKPILAAVAVAFLAGGGIAGYAVYRYAETQTPSDTAPESEPVQQVATDGAVQPTPTPSATQTSAAQQAVDRVAEQQGGLDQRLAAAEQRLARLDLQAQAASGNAARAEGLLIAFATRRALERGAELGFLADQLRLRFGDALPNAVRTIVNFSRDPVTMDELVARMNGLAPTLAGANQDFSWSTLRSELSQLFVVRRESTPSPQPERRIERARLFLESGRVAAAIEEVRNLPGAENASSWIRDAERYAAAYEALDLIATSAVLEPRLLRDGTGSRIEQPSPAEE